MFDRIGRSLPCKICGELYTDNIDPAVDIEKGGYIICPYCLMKPTPTKKIDIDSEKLTEAIQDKKLIKFRKKLGLTQDALAGRLGIKRRQYIKIEKGQYIPPLKVLRKFEKKILLTKPLEQEKMCTLGTSST